MDKGKLTNDTQYHGQRKLQMTDNIMAKAGLTKTANIMAKAELTKERQYHGQRETDKDN